MRFTISNLRLSIALCAACLAVNNSFAADLPANATNSISTGPQTQESYFIDLPAALRLAGAQNLDVQIAREHLKEALANRQSANQQFLPWLAPGVNYHRRDGVAQAVPSGIISDAHFQSYSPGVTLAAQVMLGDAIYNSLAAKQLVRASEQGLQAQQQDAVLNAAQGYFELARAKALVEVAGEALTTSRDYQQQLHTAVAAGIAFKGDELRVQSQTEQYEIRLRQALEHLRIAGADLARILHLDPRVELIPQQHELLPIALFPTNVSTIALVDRALVSRPELKQNAAFLSAARESEKGAVYGPLVPTIGAQVFAGGLGGGPDSGPSHFAAEGDYLVGLSWKIGPGGLFDGGRIKANRARVATAAIEGSKLKDAISSDVVTIVARMQSLGAQIDVTERNLGTATETLRLTHERKQFGVGIVLEDIQAQQDLTRARSDYVTTLSEFNKAQYALARAVGGL
ncbi:MAG TPA: TolC family protein [Candidatus Limnocylindrales bacterium]|nr:TolC family protein [Candidatus Limnocylindrales bacterium]